MVRSDTAETTPGGLLAPAQDSDSGAVLYSPPYQEGPSGGDEDTIREMDPESGSIRIVEHSSRQAAFVHCIGDGPRATFEVVHRVERPVASVLVHFTAADLTDSVVMDAVVKGSSSGWLGHGVVLGPTKHPDERTGIIHIRLDRQVRAPEDVTIQFGLQTHAGCLPYPVLGQPGSRPETGNATFPLVSVSLSPEHGT